MESKRVDLTVIETKAKRKAELYRILAAEGGLYLPPQEHTNMDFISDICFNDRKVLFSNEVRVCSVPHLKKLRTKDLIEFLVTECDGDEYLPADYTERAPPRDWIANICKNWSLLNHLGTILQPDLFQQKIKDLLAKRQEHILENNNLTIDINSRIAGIFERSQMVAVSKGKSHLLLKKNILRKERERKEEKELERKEELDSFMSFQKKTNELKEDLKEKSKEIEILKADQDNLRDLYERGIIDANGDVIDK